MKNCTKAVIAMAGMGTRLLPATKVIPKEMMPIIDKPCVQYLVEELIASGIKDIIFVTRTANGVIEDHFDSRFELEHTLQEAGKLKKLEELKSMESAANYIYVRQKGPYGNATPLYSVKHLIEPGEAFIYVYGDDLILSDIPATKQLIEKFNEGECDGVMIATEVPWEEVSKYGAFKLQNDSDTIIDIVEKPTMEEAQTSLSNLVNPGRFLFTSDMLSYIDPLALGKNGELWTVDVVKKMIEDGKKLVVKRLDGKWLTTGDPLNYLKAILQYSMRREELKSEILEYIKSEFLQID